MIASQARHSKHALLHTYHKKLTTHRHKRALEKISYNMRIILRKPRIVKSHIQHSSNKGKNPTNFYSKYVNQETFIKLKQNHLICLKYLLIQPQTVAHTVKFWLKTLSDNRQLDIFQRQLIKKGLSWKNELRATADMRGLDQVGLNPDFSPGSVKKPVIHYTSGNFYW